ncbi:Antiseptic resistance protein [Methylobacterium bullatum]|uniref:Antiseptic resistance protein n=1 Tax=Methylobacterium bullatum TaxID=570505 RepID=A0A679ISY0_9HYPH|nr:Antiseptic resistance protein [Methylobacterium bullatum]
MEEAARGRVVVAASCLGMLCLGSNGTAIMAALPTMRSDLALSGIEVEWAVNAYLLASAAFIILGGKLADRMGAGRIALAGLVLFTVSSFVIVLAAAASWLLAGRALQGVAAAFAVPGTLTLVGRAVPVEARVAAIGAWAGFLMLGFSLGPLIGGTLTHFLEWRDIFWLNGAAMLGAAIGIVLSAPIRAPPGNGSPPRFDHVGFVLLAILMVAAIVALQGVRAVFEEPARCLVPAAVAIGSLVLFIRAERRRADPFVDLHVLTHPAFLRATATGAVAMFCILPLLMFLNLDLQGSVGLALTPVEAGLATLPMSAGLLAVSLLAPVLVRRFGPRRSMMVAMLGIVGASPVVALAAEDEAIVPLAIGLLLIGAGLALPYATAPRLALAALPPESAGLSSGLVNAGTFLGGSLGVTINALAFATGGLAAVMAVIAAAGAIGFALCRAMPPSDPH